MLDTSIWRAIGNPARSWGRGVLGMLIALLPRAEHLGQDGKASIVRRKVEVGHIPRPLDVTVLDVVVAILDVTAGKLTVLFGRNVDIGLSGELSGNLAQSVMVNCTSADDDGISTTVVRRAIGGHIGFRSASDTGRISKWGGGKSSLLETCHVRVIVADNAQIARRAVQSGQGMSTDSISHLAGLGGFNQGLGDVNGGALAVEDRADLNTSDRGDVAQSHRAVQGRLGRGSLGTRAALCDDANGGNGLIGLLRNNLDAIVKHGANGTREGAHAAFD